MAKRGNQGDGGGQPTKYKVSYNEDVYKLCLLNSTDKQIADILNISEATLNNWKQEHPKFLESIKEGKEKADSTIAESLYNRAKGYSHEDTHISNYKGEITTTEITKHYPPDTAAAFIWLKNRRPEKWRDKTEVKYSGSSLLEKLRAMSPSEREQRSKQIDAERKKEKV